MAWNLGGNLDSEIMRAVLIQTIGPEKTEEYMPTVFSDHPVIVPDPALGAGALNRLPAPLAGRDATQGGGFDGIGSNNRGIARRHNHTRLPLPGHRPPPGFSPPVGVATLGFEVPGDGLQPLTDITFMVLDPRIRARAS